MGVLTQEDFPPPSETARKGGGAPEVASLGSKGGDLGIMLHDSRSGGLEGGTGLWVLGQGVRRQVTGQAWQAHEGAGSFWSGSADSGEEPVETALSPLEGRHLGGVWAMVWQGVGVPGWQVRAFSLAG